MAIIKPHKFTESAPAETREQGFDVLETESGHSYRFILRRKHIEVVQLHISKAKDGVDWYTGLSNAEKAQVFSLIMDKYRERSLGDNGFRGAAIGAMEKRMMDAKGVMQTRLFIGTNTTRWALPYFKDCAEQNMVNAATDTLAFEAVKTNEKPQPEKLKAIYIMQGINDRERPMACACGKCTDMLANPNMMDKDGIVMTIPVLTPTLRKKLLGPTTDFLQVATNVPFDTIKPYPNDGQLCVWQTSIGYLNSDRDVRLTKNQAQAQKLAIGEAINRAAGPWGLPEKRAEYLQDAFSKWQRYRRNEERRQERGPLDTVRTMLQAIAEGFKGAVIGLELDNIKAVARWLGAPAEQAAQNVLNMRDSEARLDCAKLADGTVDLGGMNQFLYEKINDTLANRLRDPKIGRALKPNERREWVKNNIRSIRCVAIQLEDGTFHYAIQADGTFDNAMPNAEVVALENAVQSLSRYGVRHVWAMEFNPLVADRGFMLTSPKEGLERLIKRAGKEIEFHYIPFNLGGLTHAQTKEMTYNFEKHKIYPSGYVGSLPGKVERHAKQETNEQAAAQLI